MLVIALIAGRSPEASVTWLPPLERAVNVVSLALLTWTFVPFLRERLLAGVGLLLINTLAVGFAYVILAVMWGGQVTQGNAAALDYNLSDQEWVWLIGRLSSRWWPWLA